MRRAFIQTLAELAAQDERIVLLTGDLGYTAIEPFAERFPARFFNVGVAEQNMIGIATGLAESGFIPFCYSIATFAVLRPFEFIRNGPVQHRLPVRIIGVGGGFDYGHNGLSHYALEDVALMRSQPGMRVIVPADGTQAAMALHATWNDAGPVYYRLAKDERPAIERLPKEYERDSIPVLRSGDDCLLLAMGPLVCEALAAAETLAANGIECAVAVVQELNPPSTKALTALLASRTHAATIEAHYLRGGLFSLASETLAAAGLRCTLTPFAVDRLPAGITGSADYLLRCHGLDPASIAARLLQTVRPSGNRPA